MKNYSAKFILSVLQNKYAFNFFSKLYPLKEAKTEEEKRAIYRFRYKVFMQEQSLLEKGVDHVNKQIKDEQDDWEGAQLYYLGTPGKLIYTFRLTPMTKENKEHFQEKYHIRELGLQQEYSEVAEFSHFVTNRALESTLSNFIFIGSFLKVLLKNQLKLVFASCAPGLLYYYRILGFRCYTSQLLQYDDRVEIRIMAFISHAKTYPSLLRGFLKRYRPEEYEACLVKKDDLHLLEDITRHNKKFINDEPKDVAKAIHHYIKDRPRQGVLNCLSERSIQQISKKSLILVCREKTQIILPGQKDSELFFILYGKVMLNNLELEAGDIFGLSLYFHAVAENPFFVTTAEKTTLLVIHRNTLKTLEGQNLKSAYELLRALAYYQAKEAQA